MKKYAGSLLQKGAWLYRVNPESKRIKGGIEWNKRPHNADLIVEHEHSGGLLGLIPASLGLVTLDIDSDAGRQWFKDWAHRIGDEAKPLLVAKSRRDNGVHVYYRCPPVTNASNFTTIAGEDVKAGIDVRGSKGYIILWHDTGVRLNKALQDDPSELQGWIPLDILEMLTRDLSAPESWQMVGSRNNDLNRDVYRASVDNDPRAIRQAARRALVQGLPADEVSRTIEHATSDGIDKTVELSTATRHRAARLAGLYHRLTPDVRNYRLDGKAADYHGLVYVQWRSGDGWVELKGTEIIDGLRTCNNMGDPNVARRALLDLASLKHYGHFDDWNGYGKTSTTDKDVLLGLPGDQAIDVTTGKVVKQKPEWRVTRRLATGISAKPPVRWLEAVKQWANGREELIDFLQLLSGYILLGGNPEHKFVFLYGDGSNGKSTFIDLLFHVFGPDYAGLMSPAIYRQGEREHATVFKILEHKRLVVSGEIKSTMKWNVANVKDITGGAPIYSRALYKDPTPIYVTGLPIFQGNHLPIFADQSLGWARRTVIVPFDNTIRRVILDYKEMLKQEAPEILGWMLDGLNHYLLYGALNPPECVTELTDDYLLDYQETDAITDDQVVQLIDAFLEVEPQRTWFWVSELLSFTGYESAQHRPRFFAMVKRRMAQLGWRSVVKKSGGQRARGYTKDPV